MKEAPKIKLKILQNVSGPSKAGKTWHLQEDESLNLIYFKCGLGLGIHASAGPSHAEAVLGGGLHTPYCPHHEPCTVTHVIIHVVVPYCCLFYKIFYYLVIK